MHTLPPQLQRYQTMLEQELRRVLPPTSEKPYALHRAMRYSVFAGGKRIRPLLCLTAAVAEGAPVRAAVPVAAALECLHTYTLIHDDLPAMDDDDLRRGKPTNHIVFGEAIAILAGDALLTLTFELLGSIRPVGRYTAADVVTLVAGATGSRGVVGGQAADINDEGKNPTAARLAYIHQHKTADLIRTAMVTGAMMAGTPKRRLKLFNKLGDTLGYAFQLTDDILNETSTEKELGKAVKSDKERSKVTGVSVWGIEKVNERILKLYEESSRLLAQLHLENTDLASLIGEIRERTH